MMNVHVRFAGSMRDLAERTEMEVGLPDHARLRDLLEALKTVLPDPFTALIIEPVLGQEAKMPALLTINRQTINATDAFAQPLKDGDSIVFIPPMEGG